MKKCLVLLLPMLLALGYGQELLVNGDFEQPITTGWVQTQGGVGTQTTDRSTDYQPDPDYEASSYQYSGAGWTKLGQMVNVPRSDLLLSFWASFQLGPSSSSCWPVGSIVAGYYDSGGNLMGETYYYYHDVNCLWTPSATLSLINVSDPNWAQYTLYVRDEIIQHLPGVNPDFVTKVEVGLYAYTSGG
jgi:hypothetical protein